MKFYLSVSRYIRHFIVTLPNIIKPQIKTVSILKDNSMKIVYLLLFELSFLQTPTTSKNYVSIFPLFLSGL